MVVKRYSFPALLSFGYEGRLWVANFVGLRGCWVEGEDREDVLKRAPSALGEYLRGCLESGVPIPNAPDAGELRALQMGEVMVISVRLDTGNE